MLKIILKALAVSAGAGLVWRSAALRKLASVPGTPLEVRPLLHRLDAVELRMSEMERGGSIEAPPEEIATIRSLVEDLERRTSDQIAAAGNRLDDLQNHLPRFIDVKVTARIREMEDRLKADILENRGKTLETFIASVESKMLDGIAGVESSLAAQSHEIGDLRERLGKTDQDLARILSTVERLTQPAAFQFPRFEAVVNGH